MHPDQPPRDQPATLAQGLAAIAPQLITAFAICAFFTVLLVAARAVLPTIEVETKAVLIAANVALIATLFAALLIIRSRRLARVSNDERGGDHA